MNLTPSQELELFTSVSIPSWISALPEFNANPAVFLNQFRNNWAFSSEQLRQHLVQHPDLIEDYLQFCLSLVGGHDKIVLAREGNMFVVFDQDHGRKVKVERFTNEIEAAISWLNHRYMN